MSKILTERTKIIVWQDPNSTFYDNNHSLTESDIHAIKEFVEGKIK